MFYNTLESLSVMQDILDKNFEDHPAVSHQLVKFLSLNTVVKAVDLLIKRMSFAKSKLNQVEVDLKSVQHLSTVGNKCDTLLGQIKDILKRLTKLEK